MYVACCIFVDEKILIKKKNIEFLLQLRMPMGELYMLGVDQNEKKLILFNVNRILYTSAKNRQKQITENELCGKYKDSVLNMYEQYAND